MESTPPSRDKEFMQHAIALAAEHMRAKDGGPFGAVIVQEGKIVGEGWNKVTSANDPTAHAEVTAIRSAAARLRSFILHKCVLYTSCEPCPMCLGAAYWARVERIVFSAARTDAAAIGFDDEELYREIAQPLNARKLPVQQILQDKAVQIMQEWKWMPGKTMY